MEEKMNILFGNSDIHSDTVITLKVEVIGNHLDEEGNPVGPLYDAETESWLARTDMNCSIYSVSASQFNEAADKYKSFIAATWSDSKDEEVLNRLKNEFLDVVAN